MTPKPIHATFAISPFLVQKLVNATIIGCRGACQAPLAAAGLVATWRTATRRSLPGPNPRLHGLAGTPMLAAPSRAAATAKRAVCKFTGAHLRRPPRASKGHRRDIEGLGLPRQRQRARYRGRTQS